MSDLLSWIGKMQTIDAARKPEERCGPEVAWRGIRQAIEDCTRLRSELVAITKHRDQFSGLHEHFADLLLHEEALHEDTKRNLAAAREALEGIPCSCSEEVYEYHHDNNVQCARNIAHAALSPAPPAAPVIRGADFAAPGVESFSARFFATAAPEPESIESNGTRHCKHGNTYYHPGTVYECPACVRERREPAPEPPAAEPACSCPVKGRSLSIECMVAQVRSGVDADPDAVCWCDCHAEPPEEQDGEE